MDDDLRMGRMDRCRRDGLAAVRELGPGLMDYQSRFEDFQPMSRRETLIMSTCYVVALIGFFWATGSLMGAW
jgi:hypothetical protein